MILWINGIETTAFIDRAINTTSFSPQNNTELRSAVETCLNVSAKGDCPDGLHGSIGEWDVSRVTNVSFIFTGASLFDSDISKWDVSKVTDMKSMFAVAKAFNGDLSRWDVSGVRTGVRLCLT